MAEAIGDFWEPWMRQADQVLEDEKLVNVVYEALLQRHPKSRTRGRLGTPAEIVLRMLLLKHIRNWSFRVVEREVRTNLLYREFTRVYAGKVPDAKSLGRQALALGPDVIQQIHQRMVELAVENKVVRGSKMRVDTTVVETNIHYPTDSSLLGDGDRVLTRLMKKVTVIAGAVGTKVRDSMRNVQRRVAEIARASRAKGEKGKERMVPLYRKLLDTTSRVMRQANHFSDEIASGVKRSPDVLKQAALEGLKREIDSMLVTIGKVVNQTNARVFGGDTHVEGKILSVFETSTEVIRKGKASKPTEFGKMVKVQEAENQIVIDYTVYDEKPSPRGTPEKRPMRDTSKPANGIRQDKVVITQGHTPRQRKSSQGSAMIGYSDSTWAEDMAPQGCDQSADPAAGNAWAARAAFAAFLAGKR